MSKPTLFSGSTQRSAEEIEQRRQCIKVAQAYYNALEKAYLSLTALEKSNDKPAVIRQDELKIFSDLLEVVEMSCNSANWDISLFFRGIGGELNKLRDRLQREVADAAIDQTQVKDFKQVLQPGMLTVYVSLYQTDGNSMRRWAAVLSNLTRLSIGRPVYRDAQAIRDIIRAKKDPKNDAYVAVNVKEDTILPPLGGVPLRDRIGNELLTIRENAILTENVIEFVHVTGCYRFIDGELVPEEHKS